MARRSRDSFARAAGLLAGRARTGLGRAQDGAGRAVGRRAAMPWLQVIADWNPFSAVAVACRRLFGNPDPSALVQAWPMQHPELAVLLWSGLLLVVFLPLAVRMYANKQR